MKKLLKIGAVALGAALLGTSAMAAGSGTGIEAGFTDVGTDLNTLLGGAGGFIIIVVSIMLGALMLAIGRGWTYAATAFGCAMFLGYGVTAFQGIAGVSATTDILLMSEAAVPADVVVLEANS